MPSSPAASPASAFGAGAAGGGASAAGAGSSAAGAGAAAAAGCSADGGAAGAAGAGGAAGWAAGAAAGGAAGAADCAGAAAGAAGHLEHQDRRVLADFVAGFDLDLLDHAGGRRQHLHRSLVAFEGDQRRFGLDRVADLDQHLDDRHLVDRADIGHPDFLQLQPSRSPVGESQTFSGSGLVGVDAVTLHRFGRVFGLEHAVVGQRLERGDHHPAAVDLEEVAQRLAGVAAAEAVGAEGDVAAVGTKARIWSA